MPSQEESIRYVLTAEDKASATMRKLSSNMERADKSVGGLNFAFLKTAAASTGAVLALKKLATSASDLQQLQISFETMLGSADEATAKIAELSQFAAKTPFTLPGVENAARQLLAVGFQSQELIPTLKAVGDVAAGIGRGQAGLDRLILNLGQVRTQGKLTGRELRDFAVNGVPLLEALADSMGKTKAEIQEMTSAGKISSSVVEKAFKSMSSEGGRFANLMSKQNQTIMGQWSNLQDQVELLSRTIGTQLSPAFLGFIKAGQDAVGMLNFLVTTDEAFIRSIREAIVDIGRMAEALNPLKHSINLVTNAMWRLQGAISGTDSTAADFDKVLASANLSVKNSELALERTMQKARDLGFALPEVTENIEAFGGSTEDASKEAEKLADKMLKLGEEYADTNREIHETMTELRLKHEQTMKGLEKDIEGVSTAITDLKSDYEDTLGAMNTDMAELVIDQKNRVKELQEEIKNASDTTDIIKMQEELEKAKSSLARMQEQFESEAGEGAGELLNEAQRRSELESNERRFEDMQKMKDERQAEFEDRLAKLDEEKSALQSKMVEEEAVFTSQRLQMQLTQEKMQFFHDNYVLNLQDMSKVTNDMVDDMNRKLSQLQSLIEKINSAQRQLAALQTATAQRGLTRARATGGAAEGLTLVGEQGPELLRLPQGSHVTDAGTTRRIQSKNEGQEKVVQLTISAPIIGQVIVKNEADEDRLAQKVQQQLAQMIHRQNLRAN